MKSLSITIFVHQGLDWGSSRRAEALYMEVEN